MPVTATFLDDTEMRMNGSEGVFAFKRRRHFKREKQKQHFPRMGTIKE